MRAVILTKSAMKKNGRQGACVTAFNPDEQRLVRFVSDTDGSPIPYTVSRCFELLDEVDVDVLEACPIRAQTENLLVDTASFRRQSTTKYTIEDICSVAALNTDFPLFMSCPGHKLASIDRFDHSIEIIRVSQLDIIRSASGSGKATFYYLYRRISNISVTDSRYDIRACESSCISIGDAFLVVSIPTEPFVMGGDELGYYKFIAAIYPID